MTSQAEQLAELDLSVFSVWLMPTASSQEHLGSVVARLAEQHATPLFEPHLTLYYGVNGTAAGIHRIATQAAEQGPLELALVPEKLGYTENVYTQAMYLQFALTPDLSMRSRSFGDQFEGFEGYALRKPHVSLQYSDFGSQRKAQIREELLAKDFPDLSAMQFDRLLVIGVGNNATSLNDPKDWVLGPSYSLTK